MKNRLFYKPLFWFCAVADVCADGKGPFQQMMEAMIRNGRVEHLPGNRLVDAPLELGGRIERYSPYESGILSMLTVRASQKKFLDNSAELHQAISDCRQNPRSQHHNIRLFSDMLERVKGIQDKHMQVMLVQAWVNLFLRYDEQASLRTTDYSNHHSLKNAIVLKRGMCDEVARLKLFALEELGFPQNDVRFVRFSLLSDGKVDLNSHGAALVRLGREKWILHNFHPYDEQNRISKDFQYMRPTTYSSMLEDDVTGLNLDNRSYFLKGDRRFVPDYSFNSSQRAEFASIYGDTGNAYSVLAQRSYSNQGYIQLSDENRRDPRVRAVLNSACTSRPRHAVRQRISCKAPQRALFVRRGRKAVAECAR